VFVTAVRFLPGQRFDQVVRLAFLAIILLLSINAESYAGALTLSGHESTPPVTLLAGLSVSDENLANSVPSDGRSRNYLVSKATFSNISTVSSPPVAVEQTLPTTLARDRAPDWGGLGRDAGIIAGAQLAAVAITYVLPESFSSWSKEDKKAGWSKYKKNVVHPVMDTDAFYINYILHPYWGATYYTRARERGMDVKYSVAYSFVLSAMYEFGTEAIAEKPSIQDLIATPLLGSLLGALIEPYRDSIKRKADLAWYDHAALILTDPLGVFSLGLEKMLGIKSTVMVNYSPPKKPDRSSGSALASNGSSLGVVMQFPFN